ncbi:MAG TPA: hypothetical protein VIP46_02050 [Pyrinomonadaceae bacterium]
MSAQPDHRREHTFPVACAWCGAEIRRVRAEGRPEMCPACFRSMVNEHARRAPLPHNSVRVSDR